MLLISPTEVITLAFMPREEISPESIRSLKIDVAQENYIRPRLGQTLFEEMCEGQHAEFVNLYLKPALAQYVRAAVIEEVAVQISDKGVIVYSAADNANKKQQDNSKTQKQETIVQKIAQEESLTGLNTTQNTSSNVVDAKTVIIGEETVLDITTQLGRETSEDSIETTTEDTTLNKSENAVKNQGKDVTSNGSVGVETTFSEQQGSESLRVATPIERRILCLRAMADAKVLLAKAVRYVERNVEEFSSYEPRELSSRIFF